MKFLFLDFDGVLHGHYGRDAVLWKFLPRLEAALRDYPETRVVISSSWGDGRSMDELRAFFSLDIAARIVDKVTTHRRRMQPFGERGEACRRFCRRHKLRAGDWLAIDDCSSLFRRSDPLISCLNGFREEEEFELRLALANEIPAWRFAFETVGTLFWLEFDRNAQRAREYVLEHRTERDNMTLAQLLFARRRRAVERHMYLLDGMRPPSPRLTDEERERIFGDMPNYQLFDGVLTILPKGKK
jgi:hypothetical protein